MGAVRQLLAQSGSFSGEAVAARAGTAPATFYKHFASKDDALAQAFGEVLDDLLDVSAGWLDGPVLERHGLTRLCEGLVEDLIRFFRADALVIRAAVARMGDHRGLREVYRDADARARRLFEQFITTGQELGLLPDGDPAVIAEASVVITQGLNNPLVLRSGAPPELPRLLASVLAGLLAPAP